MFLIVNNIYNISYTLVTDNIHNLRGADLTNTESAHRAHALLTHSGQLKLINLKIKDVNNVWQ